MLPKENRLKNKKDFERVFKEGKGFREGPLFLKVVKNGLRESRFGFIVSKKVFKKATARNKIKRQLRWLVGNKVKAIKKGIDGILVVSPGLKNQNFPELAETIDRIFSRAKLLKPK